VGVDTAAGKNLVGAFHPPKLVVADVGTLRTLAAEHRAQGLVEALKHGAILDASYFDQVADAAPALLDGDGESAGSVVLRSVQLKAEVVASDEREAGRRQILNFGHTVGHAIEAASEYRLGHGTAVAAGMILEARLGERLGVTEEGSAARIEGALARLGLGLDGVPAPDVAALGRYLLADKKARSGTPRYVLLRRIGEVASQAGWSREAPPSLVAEILGDAWRR
jgi:3-dehydroquinate synthase